MLIAVKTTPTQIEEWVREAYRLGGKYKYSKDDWPKNLFDLPHVETIAWLERRFRETVDEDEYYGIMPYLYNEYDEKSLFIPFYAVVAWDLDKGFIRKTKEGVKVNGRITRQRDSSDSGNGRVVGHGCKHFGSKAGKDGSRGHKTKLLQNNMAGATRIVKK